MIHIPRGEESVKSCKEHFFRLQEYIIQPCLKPGFPVSRIMIPKSSFSYDLYIKRWEENTHTTTTTAKTIKVMILCN